MATTSKKKLADQAVDHARNRLKSGVNYTAKKAKEASHEAIDMTRRVKHKAKRSARNLLNTSGEMIEETGRTIKSTGRKVKRAA